jgi:MFS family permease
VSSLATATVFIGSITGQLTMGYAGDVLGIDIAMGFALSLAALSAFLSSLLPFGSPRDVYIMIIACRFLMVNESETYHCTVAMHLLLSK